MESKEQNEETNKNRLTDTENKVVMARWEGVGEPGEGKREEEVAYVECLLPFFGGEEGEEEGCVRNPSLTIKSFKIIFFLSPAFK